MLCVIKIKFCSALIIKEAPSTILIFVIWLLFQLLNGSKQSGWPFLPGLLCICIVACWVLTATGHWNILVQPATRMLKMTRFPMVVREYTVLYFLHGQMNIKAEVQRWKMTDLKIIAELFPLNCCRVRIDGYLHNLTGILIIVSGICMQMT